MRILSLNQAPHFKNAWHFCFSPPIVRTRKRRQKLFNYKLTLCTQLPTGILTNKLYKVTVYIVLSKQ